ncbi:hypothetical protein [Glutamicibacter sp. V16R2B1]|uniref:hypothetical protein n=1 Tax=Glutamicibacter sp. V16R2B1 TaxID=2036207 RepID=UPI0010FD81B5|nr:hypothetical protein [Glutamicibacter sp. V16R2B1]TLK50907.1 hypothetical protein FDN03_10780 [Glutamicibacter sp. V16R2B1]
MTWKTINESVTVCYPQFTMTGSIEQDPAQPALAQVAAETGEDEVLSIDLFEYGYVPAPGEIFIKDWSKHHGFAAALQAAGVIEIVGEVFVGPFTSRAYRVRVHPNSALRR